MARTAGSTGEKTAKAIAQASLLLFAERGYAAVSMRAIAEKVGIQVGALYNHFKTKQDVLAHVMLGHMEELLAAWDQVKKDPMSPPEALEAFVRFHLAYHMTRHHEVFTSFMELRSLETENFTKIEALRKRYEYDIRDILDEGQKQGIFAIKDAHVSAMALLAMLTGVTTWFKTNGRLDAEAVEDIYLSMAFRAVGHSADLSLQMKKAI